MEDSQSLLEGPCHGLSSRISELRSSTVGHAGRVRVSRQDIGYWIFYGLLECYIHVYTDHTDKIPIIYDRTMIK